MQMSLAGRCFADVERALKALDEHRAGRKGPSIEYAGQFAGRVDEVAVSGGSRATSGRART